MTLIDGEYYTVNPQAIRTGLDVYGENIRKIVPIESEEFGTVMTVWVGAMSKSSWQGGESRLTRSGRQYPHDCDGGPARRACGRARILCLWCVDEWSQCQREVLTHRRVDYRLPVREGRDAV